MLSISHCIFKNKQKNHLSTYYTLTSACLFYFLVSIPSSFPECSIPHAHHAPLLCTPVHVALPPFLPNGKEWSGLVGHQLKWFLIQCGSLTPEITNKDFKPFLCASLIDYTSLYLLTVINAMILYLVLHLSWESQSVRFERAAIACYYSYSPSVKHSVHILDIH